MSAWGTFIWLARHEVRLAWRDWRDMITAGGRRSLARASAVLVAVALVFHFPVWAIASAFDIGGSGFDRSTLAVTSAILFLFGSLLVAQAMETVTRSLYTRGDLDLIVSSPVPLTMLFSVRIIANALPITVLALVLSMPLVNILVLSHGPRWLAGFGVAMAFGAVAAAVAVMITIGLFKLLGPQRTRLVAQIVAAVVGAGFAIGIQLIAIVSYGTIAGGSLLLSADAAARLPAVSNPVWIPARAALGDIAALVTLVAFSAALVVAVVAAVAPRLAGYSLSATDLPASMPRRTRSAARGVAASPARALRRKEWALLRRDPWLASQTLTQLFYLIPPALLLSMSLGGSQGTQVVIVMVLVTVGGQLGGALAWLAISGEDAPDLVATAPVQAATVTRAKIEAVMIAVGLTLAPLIAVFAVVAPFHASIAALGVVLAAGSTIRIQLWFRVQARRSHFRRRHSSSRLATFAEAMTSFSWAAAAGLAATPSWFAMLSVVIVLVILGGARSVSPRAAPV